MACKDCISYEKDDGTCHENPPREDLKWPKVPPDGWCQQYVPSGAGAGTKKP